MVGGVGADSVFASIWSTDAGPRFHRQFPYKATNSYQQNAPAPRCFEDALSALLVMRVVRHTAVRPKIDLHREPGHPRSRRADRKVWTSPVLAVKGIIHGLWLHCD
jgi:hypothetical protein